MAWSETISVSGLEPNLDAMSSEGYPVATAGAPQESRGRAKCGKMPRAVGSNRGAGVPQNMHVGLNLIYLVPGETGGMEVYARELIPALVDAAPQVRFTAFVNREAAARGGPWGELLPAVTVPVNARRREQWVLGEQALLPALAARAGVDVVHSLASTAPVWGRFRRVVTVHDLIYARFPEAHSGIRDRGMRVLVPLAVRRSRRVIAISHSTCRDLVELLGTPAGKIDVVPQGLGAVRRAPALAPERTRERLGLEPGRQVLLALSAKRPHKNLLALIGALARIPPERRPLLVLPGYPTWHEPQLRARAAELGIAADVRLHGWLEAQELEGLWALCDAFVYPSLYEGFGLPVLEAMARGVPVACARASSLPEVAGDAALLFDPGSEEEIARAIERLLGDPALAQSLRARGALRAREFTWQRTARLTLDTYSRALGRGPRASSPGAGAPGVGSSEEFGDLAGGARGEGTDSGLAGG
jgi:glycosyltransferase involved in cell wall biosynthesis